MTRTARESKGLDQLLDNASSFERLAPDEERDAARELVALRRQRWEVALRTAARVRHHAKAVGGDAAAIDLALWSGQEEPLLAALMQADPDGCLLDRLEADSRVGERTRRALSKARRDYQRARNDFMCRNLRLVVVVAKRLGRLHLSLADRVQEGNLGLMKAIDRFDPERGHRFSTYAAWWIRHAVTRALMKHGRTVRIPAHLHARFTKIRRARPELESALGRPPTIKELAEHLGETEDRVQWALDAMELRSVSIDAPTGGSESRSLAEVIPEERGDDWTTRIEDSFDVPLAQQALGALTARDAQIVQRRYGLDGAPTKTLKELGRDHGLSRERIRQLQVRAVSTLRETMSRSAVPSLALA